MAAARRRNKELDLDELEFIRRNSRLVGSIGAKSGGVSREKRHEEETLADVSLTGVEPVIGDIELVDVAEGRYFTDAENRNSLRVAFIGADVQSKLFPRGGAVGSEIYISGLPYPVVAKMKNSDFDVLFLTGVGEVFPYIRTHTILNNLQSRAKDRPTVLFFPGKYTQSSEFGSTLDLFDRMHNDRYYRAFNIFHVTA